MGKREGNGKGRSDGFIEYNGRDHKSRNEGANDTKGYRVERAVKKGV